MPAAADVNANDAAAAAAPADASSPSLFGGVALPTAAADVNANAAAAAASDSLFALAGCPKFNSSIVTSSIFS